jgi:protein-S-isoprenylcysteine O-methyltransferase Ste14
MRIPIPAVVVPLTVLLLYVLLPGVRERPWTALRIAGAIVAVIAYGLVFAARIQLGKSFSVRPQAKELVTLGLYSRFRNPMYVFVDIMLFGVVIAFHAYWLSLILPPLVVFQTRQARHEAEVLKGKFGQAYLDYRKQTWF